ncbi:MAG: substrate-binding domain-containing protein [Opitutales bacterium]|nr:substrate-binding domain-containing protein [Opitutales bacterium]
MLDQRYHYLRQVVPGVIRYKNAHPNILFAAIRGMPVQDFAQLPMLRGADGWIVQLADADQLKQVEATGLPFVNISNLMSFGGPRVVSSEEQVGALAARHLLDCGLREFAFWGNREHVYSQEREAAFTRVIEQAGFTVRHWHARTAAGAQDAFLARTLSEMERPLGVMAANDRFAMAILHTCMELGRRVPEQVAVIGVDNDTVQAEMLQTPLSSVALNGNEVGYQAMLLLHRLMRGEPWDGSVLRVPPVGVVARASTDILLVEDLEIRKALRYMRANFARLKSVEDVLAVVPLSRRPFEIRFRRVVGRSPYEELCRLRLELARSLLLGSSMSLTEIGSRCGFESIKEFSYFFCRHVGLSPGKFRKSTVYGSDPGNG